MKVKKTMKYKKNKNTVQIGGIFGIDFTKKAINVLSKEYVDKLLVARGLSQEQADEISNQIFSDPRIVKKINMLTAEIEKAETRIMNQGRHNVIGAIPIPEVGDIINIIIDTIINAIDAAKQAKSAYDINKDILNKLDSLHAPNLPTSTGATLGSRAMDSFNKFKARSTAAAKSATDAAKSATKKATAAAAAATKKATAAAAAATKNATDAAKKVSAAKRKGKGGTKKRHKKNKKTRKYRKKLSKKH